MTGSSGRGTRTRLLDKVALKKDPRTTCIAKKNQADDVTTLMFFKNIVVMIAGLPDQQGGHLHLDQLPLCQGPNHAAQ